MQLVAYFNGITKDRRLCEEVHDNLAYRWFCRLSLVDDVPDHSSLTRIRDRLGEEVFEAVFRRIVGQCQEKGLVKEDCRVMTDATLIAADASLDSLVHDDPEQAKQEAEAQQHRRGTFDEPCATQAIQPDASQPHRSRRHAGSEEGNAAAAQIQSASDDRCRQSGHLGYGGDDRSTARQPAVSRAARARARSLQDHDSVKRLPIAVTARRRSFARSKVNRRSTYIPLWSGRVGNSKYLKGEIGLRERTRSLRCPEGKYLIPNPDDHRKPQALRHLLRRLSRLPAGVDLPGSNARSHLTSVS